MIRTREVLFFSSSIGGLAQGGKRALTKAKVASNRYYSLALARDVPASFSDAISKFSSDQNVDMKAAKLEHERYLENLRRFVPTICLPALDSQPDSVFVEDTVIAIGKSAIVTNPGHPSRRGEVDTIRDALFQLGYNLADMREMQGSSSRKAEAVCDGGDVLYTSRHLFVGLSKRTNAEAVDLLADTFEGVQTIAVPFADEALHLKSIVSHLDPTTLLAPTGHLGDEILKAMKAEELGYKTVRLPNMLACNVVAVNGGVLAQDGGCEESRALLLRAAEERELDILLTPAGEFAKRDGALTCCSVLLSI